METTFHFPVIAAVMVAVLGLLQAALMLNVGLSRLKHTQGIGTGGHEDLEQKIRVHGNLAENLPLVAVLIALLEIATGPTVLVAALAGTFVVARIAHAVGLSVATGPHPLRAIGAFGTIGVIVASAGVLLWTASGA